MHRGPRIMEFETFTLLNGIRFIHTQVSSPVAYCGFFIHTGSRDEIEGEMGMAHFAEHIFFKATHKRNTYQILSRLEDVGGDMNAYTTKEETCIQASFMVEHYERTLELMHDLIFNHRFLDKDIENEKEVVIDEINSYRDTPSENIFDDVDAQIFRDHPLGHPILGTAAAVRRINSHKMDDFVAQRYFTDRMVIASVGAWPFKKLVNLCKKYFSDVPPHLCHTTRLPFTSYAPSVVEVKKRIHQSHCVIGNTAYSLYHPRRLSLILLTNLLGGPGMNTRLNLALREHKGLSYAVEASYSPYTDTGIASVYFSSEKNHTDQCLEIVHKELEKIRNQTLGTLQLHRAQQQIIGQVAISSDSNENQMLYIGKSFMVYDKVDTLAEICEQVHAITAQQLLETANEIFDRNRLSLYIYR